MGKASIFCWLLAGFAAGTIAPIWIMPDCALRTVFWWGLLIGGLIGFVIMEALRQFADNTRDGILRKEIEEAIKAQGK